MCSVNELQDESGGGLLFLALSVLEGKLNFIGFFGLFPKTIPFRENLLFVLTCDLKA